MWFWFGLIMIFFVLYLKWRMNFVRSKGCRIIFCLCIVVILVNCMNLVFWLIWLRFCKRMVFLCLLLEVVISMSCLIFGLVCWGWVIFGFYFGSLWKCCYKFWWWLILEWWVWVGKLFCWVCLVKFLILCWLVYLLWLLLILE